MAALDLFRSQRDLFVNLTLRELRGKYKRSVLGWAWSLLNPLATMVIFSVVFRYFLKIDVPVGDPSGLHVFAFYLLCALLPWNLLANGMTGGMGALLGNANLIKKVFFPRSLLVGANTASLSVSLLIELGVLAAALLVAGNMVLPWLPAVLAVVAVQALFVLGVALLLAVTAVYFRDLEHLVGIVLQLWFYATPIIYPASFAIDALRDKPLLRWLYEANPMTRFASIYRDLLYHLRGPELVDVAAVVGWTVVVLGIGAFTFHRLEPRLAEEL
ncbi:MAG: ABC transporter permease [Acidimicrobiales bacterium]|nr:ABC transporter permease [Acidimicrobiales bacterium]